MRKARLELARLAALEPKSSASTNSATLARFFAPDFLHSSRIQRGRQYISGSRATAVTQAAKLPMPSRQAARMPRSVPPSMLAHPDSSPTLDTMLIPARACCCFPASPVLIVSGRC